MRDPRETGQGELCRHEILRWACAMCLGEDLAAATKQLGLYRTLLEHAVDSESAIVEVATRTSTPEGAAVPCEYHRELMRQWIKNVRIALAASGAAKPPTAFTQLVETAGPLPTTGMASASPLPATGARQHAGHRLTNGNCSACLHLWTMPPDYPPCESTGAPRYHCLICNDTGTEYGDGYARPCPAGPHAPPNGGP